MFGTEGPQREKKRRRGLLWFVVSVVLGLFAVSDFLLLRDAPTAAEIGVGLAAGALAAAIAGACSSLGSRQRRDRSRRELAPKKRTTPREHKDPANSHPNRG